MKPFSITSTAFRVFLGLLLSAVSIQAAVTVQRVNFTGIANDWVQIEIQLLVGENTHAEARDRNFVEKVGVQLSLAYERGQGQFDYFQEEVEILIMERGDTANVYFFLAGPLVKRDRLTKSEPFAFLVDLTAEGVDLPLSQNAVGSRIRSNETAINSLRQNATSEGRLREGFLMPSYFAPLGDIRPRMRAEPTYIRRDGR